MNRPSPLPHVVRLEVNPIALTEDEHAYVIGAFAERRRQEEADGRAYHFTDFIRDALIEAAHH